MFSVELADELLLKIFQEVHPIVSHLQTMRLVCRKWNLLLNDDFLWKFYFQKYISTISLPYSDVPSYDQNFSYQDKFKFIFTKCRKYERKENFAKLFLFIISFGFDRLLHQLLYFPQNSPFQCPIGNSNKGHVPKEQPSSLNVNPPIKRNFQNNINHSRKTPPLPSKLPTPSNPKASPIHPSQPSFSLPPPPPLSVNNVHKSNLLQIPRQDSLLSPNSLLPVPVNPNQSVSFIKKSVGKIQKDPEILGSEEYTLGPFRESIFHIIAENHYLSILLDLFEFFCYNPSRSSPQQKEDQEQSNNNNNNINAYLDVNKMKQSIMENRIRILLNYQDERGRTPLYISAKLGYSDLVPLLLTSQNIHYHTINTEGKKTALHAASENGSFFVLHSLLSYLSLPDNFNHKYQLLNQLSSTNQTALHYAAQSGHYSCAQLLLQHNIDKDVISSPLNLLPSLKNNSGFTAEQIASEMGYFHIRDLIKSHSSNNIISLDTNYPDARNELHNADVDFNFTSTL